MFNTNAADASIPRDNGGRLQNHPSDSGFDEMLYDVYEDRSIVESNPMIAKRKVRINSFVNRYYNV